MDVAKFYEELEQEQGWRTDELRFLQNRGASLVDAERSIYNRALVPMLYAHFEGFCKFALLLYVRAINESGTRCQDAQPAIVASAWRQVFLGLYNPDSGAHAFKGQLPEDFQLRRTAREREFAEGIHSFTNTTVRVPDNVVDTESNLWPAVLRKNLFRLGLDTETLKDEEGKIHRLINTRNDIAHGSKRAGVRTQEYIVLRNEVLATMNIIKRTIASSIIRQAYRRGGSTEAIVDSIKGETE